jgi:thiol-disulfide isomerase/thioredoxin
MVKTKFDRKFIGKAANFLFIGVLLLIIFNPSAKAWVLRQVMHTGLFSAEIEKQTTPAGAPSESTTFSYKGSDGRVGSTADLNGKVVFINFWATWCPPCRAEMPDLNELVKKFENDERIVFLFINEDNDIAKAEAYLRSNKFDIPLMESAGNIPPGIYSGTLPTTVILNKEGKVVFRNEGLAKYNTTKFVDQLKAQF